MRGPTGSIYHRFQGRAHLLAEVWLESAERFQQALSSTIDGPPEALTAVTFDFCRDEPHRAAVLLRYRAKDFEPDKWPVDQVERAAALREDLDRMLRRLSRRFAGRTNMQSIRQIRLAICDLPLAAVRPSLENGRPVPKHLRDDVARGAAAILGVP